MLNIIYTMWCTGYIQSRSCLLYYSDVITCHLHVLQVSLQCMHVPYSRKFSREITFLWISCTYESFLYEILGMPYYDAHIFLYDWFSILWKFYRFSYQFMNTFSLKSFPQYINTKLTCVLANTYTQIHSYMYVQIVHAVSCTYFIFKFKAKLLCSTTGIIHIV